MIGKPSRPCLGFLLKLRKALSSPAISPPHTECFDIFSPLPGDSDVTTQVDRLVPMRGKSRQDRYG